MKNLSNTKAELVQLIKKRIFAKSSTSIVLMPSFVDLIRLSILSVPLVKHVFAYGNDPNLLKVESKD